MKNDKNIKINYNINKIVIIQKYIRSYIIRKKILIPQSFYQTKNWRINREWYKNGKCNECEKHQINLIEKMIDLKLNRTDDRINMETNEILNNRTPMIYNDGYEWTENFDGKIIKNNNIYYFNLKFICNNGGAQTRSLKDVYNFIKNQLKYLIEYNKKDKTNKNVKIYFINILDGDTSFNNMDKFIFLVNKKEYKDTNFDILKYVFIGSLYDFQNNKYKLSL